MTLRELYQSCEDYLKGKQTEQDKLELNSVFAGIKVYPVISLTAKKVSLNLADVVYTLMSSEFSEENTLEMISAREKIKFFALLLSYTDVDRQDEVQISDLDYEKVILSGLVDYIEERCKADYERLVEMYGEFLNISTLMETTKALESTKQFVYNEDWAKFEKKMEDITPEMLESIKTIFEYNDPKLREVKKMMEEEAAKVAKK